MKISDVLRKIADAIQSTEDSTAFNGRLEPVELAPGAVATSPAGPEKTPAGTDANPELFLPPLQQKQELLKKAVGVQNVYDDGTPEYQEFEREKRDGDWTGPDHEYDYVGDPDSQTDAQEIRVTVQADKATDIAEDDVARIKKLAGLNPVVLASLTDDVPE
jgi:hypothetical protein